MRTANTPQNPEKRFRSVILIAVFMILAAVVAVPFYTARSSSLPSVVRQPSVPAQAPAPARQSGSISKMSQTAWPSMLQPLMVAPEGIATFNSDCVTPQSDFFLGEVVCAKAAGVPGSLFPWQVLWVDPAGFVRDRADASTDESTTYMYTLPSTPTSTVNDQTVDNRGTWNVSLARSNGAIRQTARFTVHQAANPVSDVYVQKFERSGEPVSAGSNVAFTLIVGNAGPDPAVAVSLVDSVPAGASLVQITQNSGPACLPANEGNCTIASLTNGDRAEFTVIYDTGSMAAGNYQATATVSSTTTDPNNSNNTAAAPFTLTANTGGGTECQLLCPDSITAIANTTEGGNRGAHVSFADAVTSGDCGTVTATPASGSFFQVGQTTVSVTSSTGDGSCTFTVTVEDSGTNPPAISCPSNKTANANNDCEASVVVGNPTVSGDNVTFHGVRSDGKAMYNCDCFPNSPDQLNDSCNVNGACSRKNPDAPFAAGVTTITWIAYAHDIAGPYATPEDEEAHRVGAASCTQTITVNDVTPPVIAATNSTVSADASCQAPVPDYSTTVSDNCACSNSDTSPDCQGHPNFTVTQTPAAGTMVGLGPHTIHIEANDNSSNNGGAGNVTTKDVTFTVNDTTAPVITCPANISNVPTETGTCAAHVTPGTATATDNCDSTPTITASRSDGRPLTDTYPKGTTTITWTATDDSGNQSSCTQTITVVDNQPPVIVFNGQTPSMWPPNHKYQTFQVTNFVSSVTDNCGSIGVSSVFITKVTSDEIENGNGDGNTTNDIVIAANCKSVQLRSEREGDSNGRVYTIFFKVIDSSGNVGTGTAKVVVQHNPGETAVDSGVHYTVMSACP